MGTCCAGRANKPLEAPVPPPKPAKRLKDKPRPLLPAPTPVPTKSALESIANLGVRVRNHINQLLAPTKAAHTEYGEEVLQGYLKVTQVLHSQESVGRLLVFSNYALYFLEPLDFTLESHCEVLNILLITLHPAKTSAILHQSLDHSGDIWVASPAIEEILQVAETSFYNKRNKYIPCTTAERGEGMSALFNQRSRENMISYHSPEYEEITRMIIQHGKLGENRIYFRKTKSCSSTYPVLEDFFVLITTNSIYVLKDNYALAQKIDLEDVWDVAVAEDDSCQAFSSSSESRLCYLDKGFRKLMEEILLAKRGKVKVKKRADIEGRFRRAYHPE